MFRVLPAMAEPQKRKSRAVAAVDNAHHEGLVAAPLAGCPQ
jgi:hypothetical protein